MLIPTQKKEKRNLPGKQLSQLPYQNLTFPELAEVYAYCVCTFGNESESARLVMHNIRQRCEGVAGPNDKKNVLFKLQNLRESLDSIKSDIYDLQSDINSLEETI